MGSQWSKQQSKWYNSLAYNDTEEWTPAHTKEATSDSLVTFLQVFLKRAYAQRASKSQVLLHLEMKLSKQVRIITSQFSRRSSQKINLEKFLHMLFRLYYTANKTYSASLLQSRRKGPQETFLMLYYILMKHMKNSNRTLLQKLDEDSQRLWIDSRINREIWKRLAHGQKAHVAALNRSRRQLDGKPLSAFEICQAVDEFNADIAVYDMTENFRRLEADDEKEDEEHHDAAPPYGNPSFRRTPRTVPSIRRTPRTVPSIRKTPQTNPPYQGMTDARHTESGSETGEEKGPPLHIPELTSAETEELRWALHFRASESETD